MLKFQENKLAAVADAAASTGALLKTSPKVTQSVLNSLQLLKKFSNDIKIASTTDGVVVHITSSQDISKPTEFVDEGLVEFSHAITPDLYHKKNDAQAEFRYYPALRQMLRVRSRNGSDIILADDDHNVFRASGDIKYISAKQSVIPIFFPKLIKDRKEAVQKITDSNEARGMSSIKAGDKVMLREYSDMKAEFGDEKISFGYGDETMRVTAAIKGADSIVFTDHATHLCGQTFKVKKVSDDRQEITLTDPQTKLINPTSGKELPNVDAIRFSKLHFIKV